MPMTWTGVLRGCLQEHIHNTHSHWFTRQFSGELFRDGSSISILDAQWGAEVSEGGGGVTLEILSIMFKCAVLTQKQQLLNFHPRCPITLNKILFEDQ